MRGGCTGKGILEFWKGGQGKGVRNIPGKFAQQMFMNFVARLNA